MVSFILSLVALILGYLLYGRFVEKVFGPDDRVTPAVAKADGVDYLVLPGWKIFMIQFLNIAGTGPIFGAILGAKFGPVAYLWIVLGCIFAGATHDYLSGMLSMRNDGASLPELIGKYLGRNAKMVMLAFRTAAYHGRYGICIFPSRDPSFDMGFESVLDYSHFCLLCNCNHVANR